MPVDFDGAKLALVHPDGIVTILRDDRNDIPHPGMWDFAGGGREGAERPEETVLRETWEELGLKLGEDRLLWSICEDRENSAQVWFFVAEITDTDLRSIRLGDEGQRWHLMPVGDFLSDPLAIPSLKRRLRLFLKWRDQNRCPR